MVSLRKVLNFRFFLMCLFLVVFSACSSSVSEELSEEEVVAPVIVVELEKSDEFYQNNQWYGYSSNDNLGNFSENKLFPDGLLAFQDGTGLWGYLNESGEVIIEPQFDLAYQFDELVHRASVVQDGLYGFIDTTGAFVVEPIYARTYDFESGYAAVQLSSGLWGYIDANGHYLYEPILDTAYDFVETTIVPYAFTSSMALNGQEGFIDANGQVYQFSNDIAKVYGLQENGYFWANDSYGNLGLFNINGEAILDFNSSITGAYTFGHGRNLAMVAINGLYGYIDEAGSFVVEPQYKEAYEFVDGYALVMNSTEYISPLVYSFINESGESAVSQLLSNNNITGGYETVPRATQEDTYAFISDEGTWAYFDYSGQMLFDTHIPLRSDIYEGWAVLDIGQFSHGIAWFVNEVAIEDGSSSDYLIGYFDKNGTIISDAKFQSLSDSYEIVAGGFSQDGYALVRESNMFGVIDRSGNYVITPQYFGLQVLTE